MVEFGLDVIFLSVRWLIESTGKGHESEDEGIRGKLVTSKGGQNISPVVAV